MSKLRAGGLGIAIALTMACGEDSRGGRGGDGESNQVSNNGPTNNGTSGSGENNGTMGEPDDPCATARWTGTEPFDDHERFLFDFEHPQGWTNTDTSGDAAVSGNIGWSDLVTRKVSIQYTQTADAADPETETRWGVLHEVVGTVTYDGEEVDFWSQPDIVGAKALLPHQGAWYEVSIIFQGECMPEQLALRELFFATIAPNPDTTFPE